MSLQADRKQNVKMETYAVEIWKIENRISERGPDFKYDKIVADAPEEALQKVMKENKIQDRVYAEISWNKGQDRRKFEDYSL